MGKAGGLQMVNRSKRIGFGAPRGSFAFEPVGFTGGSRGSKRSEDPRWILQRRQHSGGVPEGGGSVLAHPSGCGGGLAPGTGGIACAQPPATGCEPFGFRTMPLIDTKRHRSGHSPGSGRQAARLPEGNHPHPSRPAYSRNRQTLGVFPAKPGGFPFI